MPEAEKKLISYRNVAVDSFMCVCGSELCNKHVLVFSDGEVREECTTCFLGDYDAKRLGLLDDPNSFIIGNTKRHKKIELGFYSLS